MQADLIERVFRQADDAFLCARWGRGIAPVVFGVEPQTVEVFKSAAQVVTGIAGHEVVETDPELGANLMIFVIRDWDELRGVPDLGAMIPDLGPLLDRLERSDAESYRGFRYDGAGAIQAGFVFLRMGGQMAEVPADLLALGEMVRVMASWGPKAFEALPLLDEEGGRAVLSADLLRLMRAVYDPLLPVAAQDASHALRLAARMEATP